MNLQKKVLTAFQEQYQELTFSEIARRTEIQVTRIFRIFNGHRMKIDELEKFLQVMGFSFEFNLSPEDQKLLMLIQRLPTRDKKSAIKEISKKIKTAVFLEMNSSEVLHEK